VNTLHTGDDDDYYDYDNNTNTNNNKHKHSSVGEKAEIFSIPLQAWTGP
jgi:hypothetical protein